MKKLLLIAATTMTVASGAWALPDIARYTLDQRQGTIQGTIGVIGITEEIADLSSREILEYYDVFSSYAPGYLTSQRYTNERERFEQLNRDFGDHRVFDSLFDLIDPNADGEIDIYEIGSISNMLYHMGRGQFHFTDLTALRTPLSNPLQEELDTANATIASQDDLLLRQTLQITAKDVEIAEKDGKLTSIQDVIDAANVRVPDNITVQGQRASNRGQRGVDVQSWVGTSNARRPWQRDQVSVRTNINGDIDVYTVNIRQQLAPQIDRLARSIAKEYYDKGFDEGYEDGYENGYRDGFRDGYNQALSDVQTAKDG